MTAKLTVHTYITIRYLCVASNRNHTLRFIDPDFDQAGRRNVVTLLANPVRLAQLDHDLLIVPLNSVCMAGLLFSLTLLL